MEIPLSLLLIPLVASTAFWRYAVPMFVWAIKYCFNIRQKAWESAVLRDGGRPRGSSATDANGSQHRHAGQLYLFAGRLYGWGWEGIDQTLTHMPSYVRAVLTLLFARIPWMMVQSVYCRFTKGHWIPDVPSTASYDLLISTPLIMIATYNKAEHRLSLRLPDKLSLRWFSGESPAGLFVEFDTITRELLTATKNGQTIRARGHVSVNAIVLAHLHIACAAWLHPKSHVLAEQSAREIVRIKVIELEPSFRFVASLHEGLLYNESGPGGLHWSPLHMMTHIESLLEVLDLPVHHDFTLDKREVSEYFAFMLEAHHVMKRVARLHGCRVDSYTLFHNMVVHAVDHSNMHRVLNPIFWFSIDGSGSMRSYFSGQAFIEVWVPFMGNGSDEELLADYVTQKSCYRFYEDLYKELYRLNPDYANVVTMSCSW